MGLLKLFLVLLVLGGTLANAIGNGSSSSLDLTITTTTDATRHSFVVTAPVVIVSAPSWNNSLHGSFKPRAENKTSVTFTHMPSPAYSSDLAYDATSLASSAPSIHSAPTTSMATVDVTATYFPVRYPGISSVVSPALTTTSVDHITATVTSTSIYTRTIEVILSPTRQVDEQDPDTLDCMLSTVVVTVTGHVTVNVTASSSPSHASALPVPGSSSDVALPTSQASGAAVTGVTAPAVSPSQQPASIETHSAPAIPAVSSVSPVLSASVRASPSLSSSQTNNANSTVARPSTSPFLTPNHPDLNATVAGAGRGVEAHSGVTLSLIIAFIGGMVLFAN